MNHESKSTFTYLEILPGVHIIADQMQREQCNLQILYHAGGSWFEKEVDRGKKHLLEHCIVARTKQMNHDQLKDWEYRENIMLNAFTGSLRMGLTASGHKSDFKTMFDMLWEVAIEPTFDQVDLEREREIVLREISERRGDPNYKLYFDTQKQIFDPNSLECHEVLGNSDMVAQTSMEDFKKLHHENLQQSHIFISVAGGGLDIEYIKAKILENSKLLIKSNLFALDHSPKSEFQQFQSLPIVHELAHEHADLSLFIPIPIKFDNKAVRHYLNSMFMNYGGVLYDRLREEKQLVYGISNSYSKDLQGTFINLQCEIPLVEQILQETKEVFSDFNKYFKQNKFQEFKNLIPKKQALTTDKVGEVANVVQRNLLSYAIYQDYNEYAKELENVSEKEFETLYHQIHEGIKDWKIIGISKNPEIEKVVIKK
jgi:predicted Zn-dependent peptidase